MAVSWLLCGSVVTAVRQCRGCCVAVSWLLCGSVVTAVRQCRGCSVWQEKGATLASSEASKAVSSQLDDAEMICILTSPNALNDVRIPDSIKGTTSFCCLTVLNTRDVLTSDTINLSYVVSTSYAHFFFNQVYI